MELIYSVSKQRCIDENYIRHLQFEEVLFSGYGENEIVLQDRIGIKFDMEECFAISQRLITEVLEHPLAKGLIFCRLTDECDAIETICNTLSPNIAVAYHSKNTSSPTALDEFKNNEKKIIIDTYVESC